MKCLKKLRYFLGLHIINQNGSVLMCSWEGIHQKHYKLISMPRRSYKCGQRSKILYPNFLMCPFRLLNIPVKHHKNGIEYRMEKIELSKVKGQKQSMISPNLKASSMEFKLKEQKENFHIKRKQGLFK